MKISVVLSWLVLATTIGVTFGLCAKNTKCHECILVRDCVFVKLKNHTLLCASKDELFNLQPSSVYKTPRRCNILDKKTIRSQPESSHDTNKILVTEKLLKLFDKKSKMSLIAAEEKNATYKRVKFTSEPLDLNHTGNSEFENVSDAALNNVFWTASSVLMNTPILPTVIKSDVESEQQNEKQIADSSHHYNVSSDLMGSKRHSTVESDHQSEKQVVVSSHHSVSSDLIDSKLLPTTDAVQPKLKYPWIQNPKKYDDLKIRIIQACCLLDQLFREFGDLHFLEIDTIKNYHFVGFQIKNPINSRKYLCM